jgi:hypothetical protein
MLGLKLGLVEINSMFGVPILATAKLVQQLSQALQVVFFVTR